MSDVFEEVEEGLRHERLTRFWRRYRWLVYGLAGALVIGTAARGLWEQYRAGAVDSRVRAFEAARADLDARRYEPAIAALEPLAAGSSEIAPLAASLLAGARLEGMGDVAGAVAALETVMNGEDASLAAEARLKIAYLRADSMSLSELETFLQPLMKRSDAFEMLAIELIAGKAYATGDFVRARREFGFLRISPNAPRGVQVRAENALAVIPRPPAEDAPAEDAPDAEASDNPPVSDPAGEPATQPNSGSPQ